MYTLSADKKLAVISALIEGNSVRSTERITGVHRDTICRLLVQVGDNCAALLDERMRNLRCNSIQCDEIWTYVGKKNKHVQKGDSPELGDQWVFVAMDPESKLIPTFTVGKRTEETTCDLPPIFSPRITRLSPRLTRPRKLHQSKLENPDVKVLLAA